MALVTPSAKRPRAVVARPGPGVEVFPVPPALPWLLLALLGVETPRRPRLHWPLTCGHRPWAALR